MKKELEELISDYKQLLLKYEHFGEDEERKRQIKKELEELTINYKKLYNSDINMDRQTSGTINGYIIPDGSNHYVQDMNNKPHIKEKTKIKKSYFNSIIIKIKKLISYIQN